MKNDKPLVEKFPQGVYKGGFMLQRRMSKKRKIFIRYKPEIENLRKSGMSLRRIAVEMKIRHNLKVSFNYLSEILS